MDNTQQLNVKAVRIYSIDGDNILNSTMSSRFNALNTWLVFLYDVFQDANFTSDVGTFLEANPPELNASGYDQTLFFVLANSMQDLRTQFGDFINTA